MFYTHYWIYFQREKSSKHFNTNIGPDENVILQTKTSTVKTCSDVGVPFSFKYKELNYDAMIVYDFLKLAWLEQCVVETLNLSVFRLDM